MIKSTYAHQRLILGSLVVLWVGVLPWLCWGGWSNPHHPHANPHFVFAAPTLLDAHASASHDHGADDALAGVARPDTLLIALLVLILPAQRALLAPRQHYFMRQLATQWSHMAGLLVPTPPPRTRLSIHTSSTI